MNKKIRMNIYISQEAWNKLHEKDKMSQYIEKLILEDNGNNDLIQRIINLLEKGIVHNTRDIKDTRDIKNSVMSMLNLEDDSG